MLHSQLSVYNWDDLATVEIRSAIFFSRNYKSLGQVLIFGRVTGNPENRNTESRKTSS